MTLIRAALMIVVVLITAALTYSLWNRCENVTLHGVTICITKDGWVIR